jgi:hypothetical protein
MFKVPATYLLFLDHLLMMGTSIVHIDMVSSPGHVTASVIGVPLFRHLQVKKWATYNTWIILCCRSMKS